MMKFFDYSIFPLAFLLLGYVEVSNGQRGGRLGRGNADGGRIGFIGRGRGNGDDEGRSGIDGRINDALDARISQVCDMVSSQFNDTAMECDCGGAYSREDGFSVDISCRYGETKCLTDKLPCGTPTFYGVYSLGGLRSNTACLEFNSEEGRAITMPDLCVTGITNGGDDSPDDSRIEFDDCELTIGGQSCDCTLCEGDTRDFKFDCSGVNISPLAGYNVPGPSVDICIGLGIPTNITGAIGGLRPFGG